MELSVPEKCPSLSLENSNDSKRVMDLLNLTEEIMTNSIFENTSNLINNWKPKIIDSILPKKDLSKWVEGMLPDEKKEFEDKLFFTKKK